MANVCMFILLIFSFLIIESKCKSSHMSNVRLQLGNWLIRTPNSWICTVWEAIGPVAISSKRGSRSVVNSGSGNSLQKSKKENEYKSKIDLKVKTLTEWITSRGCKQLIYQIQRPAPFPDCYTNVWDAEVSFWPRQLCRFVHCVGHIPADNRYSLERLTANWHCHGNDFVQQPIPMKRRKLVVQLEEERICVTLK